MNIEYVQIPLALFESDEYKGLSNSCQRFLITLYAMFHDTETFTIELHEPEKYSEPKGCELNRKVLTLVKLGFLVIDSYYKKDRRTGRKRIFKFKEWK